MNTYRMWHLHHRVQLSHDTVNGDLSLRDGERTELCAGTRHNVTNDVTGVDGETRAFLGEDGFFHEGVDLVIRDVGEEEVLLDSETDFAFGVFVSKSSNFDTLEWGGGGKGGIEGEGVSVGVRCVDRV